MTANVNAAWIAILLAALVKSSALQGDYRERATQFEYRVIIEKLQGNDGRVSAIADWRREARHSSDQWEHIATRLAIASGIAVAASTVSGWMWAALGLFSIAVAGRAAFYAAQAMGVI